MRIKENLIYVIFGASGDLTKRKLIPALYALFVQDLLPEKFAIVGASRTFFTNEQFRSNMKDAISQFREVDDMSRIDEFTHKFHYRSVAFDKIESYKELKIYLDEIRKTESIEGNTIFYLSTPPSLYGLIPQKLAETGLNKESDGYKRLIIEKPFGSDL
ncbi:MAG: glucose-6-phosphate dehydrogenase, partial [Bacteroidota bacterium]